MTSRRTSVAVGVAVVAALIWAFGSPSEAQEESRGCSAPVAWGELRGGATLLTSAGFVTFEDKNGTVRIARLESKGACKVFLTVTRE